MAFLDRFRNQPTFGTDPSNIGKSSKSPTDQLVGYTTEAVDPGTVKPRIGMTPFGQSGRANFYGLPQWDELNKDLIGQRGMLRFDEMYRTDAHIRRLILAGWTPVTAGTWTLEPYGGEDASQQDHDIADTIWWMLNEWMSPNFYEHLYTLGPLLLRSGFAPFEQMWDEVKYQGKTLIGPKKLDVRLPKTVWRWWQDEFGDLTHIGQILPNKADVVIPASELTYYRLGAEGDNWMGVSLLRHAYKNWYLKDKLERLDAIGQERKAVGMPILYHSPDVPEDVLDGVEQALAQVHVSEVAYMLLPGYQMGKAPPEAVGAGQQWLMDVIQFDSSSGASIQESLEYHQTAISASFLTDFLELGHHQVGARATAEVQEDPFLTAVNGALLPPIIPPLNRLIDRIRKLNWDSAEGSPQLQLTLNDEASLSEIAAYVVPLIQAGAMQTDSDLEDWLRDRAAMPAANAQIRAQKEKAQQAAYENAAQMATTGETPDEEPPSPNSDPAQQGKPPAPQGSGSGTNPPQTNPIKGAVENNAKKLDAEGATCTCGTGPYEKWKCLSCGGSDLSGWPDRYPDGTLVQLDAVPESVRGPNLPPEANQEPTVKWWERLLSQHRLKDAMDGAREHIEASVGPTAMRTAQQMAYQVANGTPVSQLTATPPPKLVDALTQHYTHLYALGHRTVQDELAKQRRALGKTLDNPGDTEAGLAGARLLRARQRGEHSARNIVNRIGEVLGRQQISGLQKSPALQTAAEQAARGALRMEAVTNAAASINDGRAAAAQDEQGLAGAYYTSVLDDNTCDECAQADDGQLLSVDDALALGPPNPLCAGGDRCRCALVWVLDSDPAALGLGN